ncbi:MAG: hypothetical protein IJ418_08385 [Clostridia bacterium]|nr:hypothetical protein [Clostridia bacterium]
MRANRWRIACIWLVCAVMIAGLFATGILNKQKVWTDVELDCTDEDKTWRLEDGDAYGMVASGPYYDLPVGTYRIKWQIEGDGENRITLSCSNEAQIAPGEIVLQPDAWQGEAAFEIKEHTHSFSINVHFEAGTRLQIHNIRLYTPEYTDNAFAVSALLLLLCVLLTMHLAGRLTAQGMRAFALLAIAVIFASLPCLGENSPMAYDTHFHAARIMNLADGLRSGQLPVRTGGFSYNGYGAMTSVFYPDLLLYPWALMLLGGASMTFVINSLVIVVNALTAWCMLLAGKRMLGDTQAAVCASILYVLSIYRLEDTYCRLMVGEMLAMAFLPLFILALYEAVFGEKKRWPLLVLSATLVFRSHMLTTLLCAVTALAIGVLFIGKIIREKRLSAIILACAATLLINLNQIVPFLMAFKAGVNTTVWQFGFAGSALALPQMLQPGEYIGLALIFGAAAFVCAQAEEKEKDARRILWLLLLAGVVCAVLATNLVPWSHVSQLTRGLVDTLQFPWRFLLLTAVCFSLCGGDGVWRMVRTNGMHAALLTLVIAVMCSVPYIQGMFNYEYDLEFGQSAKTYMIYPEYQIAGTDVNDTRSRAVNVLGDAQMTQYRKDGTEITAQVEAADAASLEFPLFGFPGYEAKLNGEEIAWRLGSNNRLTVDLPAGAQGELTVAYKGETIWMITDALSLVSALALGLWVFGKKRRLA